MVRGAEDGQPAYRRPRRPPRPPPSNAREQAANARSLSRENPAENKEDRGKREIEPQLKPAAHSRDPRVRTSVKITPQTPTAARRTSPRIKTQKLDSINLIDHISDDDEDEDDGDEIDEEKRDIIMNGVESDGHSDMEEVEDLDDPDPNDKMNYPAYAGRKNQKKLKRKLKIEANIKKRRTDAAYKPIPRQDLVPLSPLQLALHRINKVQIKSVKLPILYNIISDLPPADRPQFLNSLTLDLFIRVTIEADYLLSRTRCDRCHKCGFIGINGVGPLKGSVAYRNIVCRSNTRNFGCGKAYTTQAITLLLQPLREEITEASSQMSPLLKREPLVKSVERNKLYRDAHPEKFPTEFEGSGNTEITENPRLNQNSAPISQLSHRRSISPIHHSTFLPPPRTIPRPILADEHLFDPDLTPEDNFFINPTAENNNFVDEASLHPNLPYKATPTHDMVPEDGANNMKGIADEVKQLQIDKVKQANEIDEMKKIMLKLAQDQAEATRKQATANATLANTLQTLMQKIDNKPNAIMPPQQPPPRVEYTNFPRLSSSNQPSSSTMPPPTVISQEIEGENGTPQWIEVVTNARRPTLANFQDQAHHILELRKTLKLLRDGRPAQAQRNAQISAHWYSSAKWAST